MACIIRFILLNLANFGNTKVIFASNWNCNKSNCTKSVVYVVNVVYLTTSPRMQCYVESGSVLVKVVI